MQAVVHDQKIRFAWVLLSRIELNNQCIWISSWNSGKTHACPTVQNGVRRLQHFVVLTIVLEDKKRVRFKPNIFFKDEGTDDAWSSKGMSFVSVRSRAPSIETDVSTFSFWIAIKLHRIFVLGYCQYLRQKCFAKYFLSCKSNMAFVLPLFCRSWFFQWTTNSIDDTAFVWFFYSYCFSFLSIPTQTIHQQQGFCYHPLHIAGYLVYPRSGNFRHRAVQS